MITGIPFNSHFKDYTKTDMYSSIELTHGIISLPIDFIWLLIPKLQDLQDTIAQEPIILSNYIHKVKTSAVVLFETCYIPFITKFHFFHSSFLREIEKFIKI